MAKDKIGAEDILKADINKVGKAIEAEMKIGQKAVEQLVKSAKELKEIGKNFGNVTDAKKYEQLLQQRARTEKLLIQNQEQLNKSAIAEERLKAQKVKTEQALVVLQTKKLSSQKRATNLTIEERVAIQQNNQVKKQQARITLGLGKTYDSLSAKLLQAKTRLADLLSQDKQNVRQIRTAQNEYAKLKQRVDAVDKATDNFSRNIGNYRSALIGLKGTFGGLQSALGITGGIFAFTQVMRNGIGTVREYDKANATLSGILRINKDEMGALTDESARLGSETVKTSTEVTQLQIAYARLGFSQNEIIDLTEATINGSIALNANLAETAELTGAVVNTFSDFESSNAPEIMDVLALATAKSALNFEQLQTGIPIVAGAANSAGVPFTRLIALMGKLSDSGIDVSTSSTALRNIFIESASQGLNYEQILQKIADSQDKLTTANDEFGKRAVVSASVLAENLSAVGDLDIALQNAQGTTKELADKELDTLDGSIKLVTSAWEGYILNSNEANNIGNTLKDVLKLLAENLKEILNGVIFLTKAYLTYLVASKATTLQQSLFSKAVSTSNKAQLIARLNSIRQAQGMNAVSVASVRASVAMRVFNKALKANAIGIAVALLFGLYQIMQKLNKSTLETAEETSKLNDEYLKGNKAKQESQKNLERLNSRYKELTKDGIVRTKAEQTELNTVVEKIQKIVPDTIVKVDEYGNKLITNAGKIQEFTTNQRKLNDLLNQTRLSETNNSIDELETSLNKLNGSYKELDGRLFRINKVRGKDVQLSTKQEIQARQNITATQEKIKQLKEERAQLILIKEQNGDVLTLSEKEIAIKLKLKKQNEEDAQEEIRLAKLKIEKQKEAQQVSEENEKKGFELYKFRQEQKIKLNKEIAEDEQNSFENRITALEEIEKAEFQLIKAEKKNALKSAENENERALIVEDAKAKIIESEKRADAEINRLSDEAFDKYKENETKKEEALQKRVDAEIKATQSLSKAQQIDFNNELSSANLIADAEAREKAIADIKIKYAKLALQKQLKSIEALIAGEKLSAEQRIDLKLRVAEITKELNELAVENTEKTTEKQKLSVQEVLQSISNLAQDIGGLLNALSDARIQNIDNEIQKNEDFFNKQIELAGDNERQKQALEEQAEQKRQQLELKKKQEQRRQAILNKQIALAEIAINTAIGVTGALTNPITIPLVPFIIASGAIQAATVLATPIPEFKEGTKKPLEKDTLAVVGDGYQNEAIVKNGKLIGVTPDKPTFMNLPRGAEVIPSMEEFYQMQRIQSQNAIATDTNFLNLQTKIDDKNIVGEIKLLRKELAKQKAPVVNVISKEPFKYGTRNA